MKKQRFNEIVWRKYTKLQQRLAKRLVGTCSLSSDIFLQAKTSLESMVEASNCFLNADSLSVFEISQHTENIRSFAAQRTAEFLKSPYKNSNNVRGPRLTRSEIKQVTHAILRNAKLFKITISLKQIGEIIKHFFPYKPRHIGVEDPFIRPLRSSVPKWVNDLSAMAIMYIQFGSNYPMWAVYSLRRTFIYEGLPALLQKKREFFVKYFPKMLDWEKSEFTKDVPALRATILKIANEKTPEILQRLDGGGTGRLDASEYEQRRVQLNTMQDPTN